MRTCIDTERLLDAIVEDATEHGLEGEPDHEVGDLQDLLQDCWERMGEDARWAVWEKWHQRRGTSSAHFLIVGTLEFQDDEVLGCTDSPSTATLDDDSPAKFARVYGTCPMCSQHFTRGDQNDE